jgi:predicted O-methyltransferase YrrM
VSKTKFLFDYIKYYFSSVNEHGVHSPFVYNLLTAVIQNNHSYYPYEEIGAIRKELLHDHREISITDLGAGSRVSSSNKRKISDIAKHSSKPAKYGKLLFRLADHFQPGTILELGTSLGISTLYLASARRKAKMISIEGCPQTAAIAQQNFHKMKLDNIQLMTGNFDDILPSALQKLGKVDLAFFDGNHRKVPTLKYFNEVLPYTHNDTVLIFDDIHWSEEMSEAWEAIKAHPSVHVTIDLFMMGIVFFRSEQREEHFMLRF